MKQRVWVIWFLSFVFAVIATPAQAQVPRTAVFNNLPKPMPGNVPSLGFQALATSEFGDLIELEPGIARRAVSVTVLMSSWSLHSNYPWLPPEGYQFQMTFSLYRDQGDAAARIPFASVTKTFTIPWRPEADPTCSGGGWRQSPTSPCYSGFAFKLRFNLKPENVTLPDQFIWGIAYNTSSWGYNPFGVPGPYESLNVGLANTVDGNIPPRKGTDVDPDVVYWNTAHAPFYTDGGAGGFNLFRPDTGWSNYAPSVKFTAASVPQTKEDCKNGGWQDLVRLNWTRFKNQGACVSYVNTGK